VQDFVESQGNNKNIDDTMASARSISASLKQNAMHNNASVTNVKNAAELDVQQVIFMSRVDDVPTVQLDTRHIEPID